MICVSARSAPFSYSLPVPSSSWLRPSPIHRCITQLADRSRWLRAKRDCLGSKMSEYVLKDNVSEEVLASSEVKYHIVNRAINPDFSLCGKIPLLEPSTSLGGSQRAVRTAPSVQDLQHEHEHSSHLGLS